MTRGKPPIIHPCPAPLPGGIGCKKIMQTPDLPTIHEIRRLAAPFPRPQALAWDGKRLWISSMATGQIVAMDAAAWSMEWETEAPGVPFGMTAVEDGLRVLCGETGEDHRIIRRCMLQQGFDPCFAWPCPDDTGSQLGYDGQHLYVSQWYNQRILRLDAAGETAAIIPSPHQICGQVIVGDHVYLMTTDDESTQEYFLTKIHLTTHEAADIAKVPFQARALAFDGQNFWTNHREAHETVCFSVPTL